MRSTSKPLQAIALMLLSMAGFSAMNVCIRLLAESMHSTQMVLLRNVFSLGLIVLWSSLLYRGVPRFGTARLKGHFWRASVGITAMELWFYSLSLMPVTLATAISFTTPIFSTVFAILFLKERAGMRRWAAIGVGIIGMLIILRPEVGVQTSVLFALSSAAIMAVAGVLVKTLTRTEAPETIVFYMSLFMIPWSLGPAVFHWQPVSAQQLGLVLVIALLSTVAHLMLARAYIRADMVMLMPFDFTRLVFTAIFAYLLFHETMDAHTIAGSLVIVASTVYIAHREAKAKEKPIGDVVPG